MPFRGGSDYLIFRRSTEARFRTDLPNISSEAVALITRCLSVDPTARPSIEEILDDAYFADCPTTCPPFNPEEQKVRDFVNDLIKRSNVHEFEGKEALEAKFAEHFASQVQMDNHLIEHYR